MYKFKHKRIINSVKLNVPYQLFISPEIIIISPVMKSVVEWGITNKDIILIILLKHNK